MIMPDNWAGGFGPHAIEMGRYVVAPHPTWEMGWIVVKCQWPARNWVSPTVYDSALEAMSEVSRLAAADERALAMAGAVRA
jgi:hypothetical protein